MINVFDGEYLLQVCEKTAQYFHDNTSVDAYHKFLRCGILENRIFVLATIDDNENMTSCAVLCLGQDLMNRLTITVDFMWIDPHYPHLFKNYLEYTERLVQEKGIKKIIIPTYKSEKAFERKYGKYGFTRAYTVFEKKVI